MMSLSVHGETEGSTSVTEAGGDTFNVVLDAQPSSNVVLSFHQIQEKQQ